MRTLALAIAAMLLLGSCSDEPKPIEPTASPSPKPAISAPALPESAAAETPNAAIAFVAHWIAAFNFAVNSGEVDEFKSLNESSCVGCKSYEDEIVRSNQGGAEVRKFEWTGGKSSLSEDGLLEATVRSRDYQVRDSPSDRWSTVKGSTFKLGLELRWRDGRWQVRELYVPEGSE